ncbi:putative ribonuclease H protein [Sesbania bispinosa]|nr:putative ribonuclease H protein [Sesbania bispinosa]
MEILPLPPATLDHGTDVPSWKFSSEGSFNAKSAYMLITGAALPARNHVWDRIWKWGRPIRAKSFLWTVFRGD